MLELLQLAAHLYQCLKASSEISLSFLRRLSAWKHVIAGVHDGFSTNIDNATSQRLVTPEHPIFVLFTSSSIGTLKGMVYIYASVCIYALAHGETMAYYSAQLL